jgi:hypothetical protein
MHLPRQAVQDVQIARTTHELLSRILSLSAGQLAQTNDSANHTVRMSTQRSPHRQKAVGPFHSTTTEIAKKSCSCYRRRSQALASCKRYPNPLEVAVEEMAVLSARSNTLCLRHRLHYLCLFTTVSHPPPDHVNFNLCELDQIAARVDPDKVSDSPDKRRLRQPSSTPAWS